MENKSVSYVIKTLGSTKLSPKPINIDGSDDQFYRYKMRPLYAQVVGKGKMIKTVLLNIDDVAKDLRAPPAYVTAYLGYDIGSQSKYDGKKPDRERAYLSGALDGGALSDCMKKYIQEVILCQNCKLPETSMSIEKKTNIVATCRGCGTKSELKLGDKFKSYVLNHPIKAITSKEERAVKKKQEEATRDTIESASPEVKPKAAKKTSKKKKKAEEPEEEWSVDTSEAAVHARRSEMLPAVANIIQTDDHDEPKEDGEGEKSEDPCSDLERFIQENPKGNVAGEVKRLQGVYGFPNSKRPHLVFEVMFSESLPESEADFTLLKQLIDDPASQLGLLVCLEKLTQEDAPLLKKLTKLLHTLYEEEVLEEETIIKWNSKKTTSARVKKEVAPFIKWLQEAEEESEEEEEEGEEEEQEE